MPDQDHNAYEVEPPPSRAPRAVLVFLLTGVVIAGTILALRTTSGASSESCSGALALTVEAAPEVSAAVRSAAANYQQTKPNVDGTCVTVRVSTRAAQETTRLLGGGWREATAGNQPDVWIPDSTAWLDMARLQEPARVLVPQSAPTIATSPVVIAVPRSMAKTLGWPSKNPSWDDLRINEGSTTFWHDHNDKYPGKFQVTFASPQTSSASAAAMMSIAAVALGKPAGELTAQTFRDDMSAKKVVLDLERKSSAIADSDEALLAGLRQADADTSGGGLTGHVSAVPMSENMMFDYNNGVVADGKATPPKEPLVAIYPTDGIAVQNIPFVQVGPDGSPAHKAAVQGFLEMMLSKTGQDSFTEAGLRGEDGTAPKLTTDAGFSPGLRFEPAESVNPAATGSALALFQAVHQRGATLAVIDTSGTMGGVVADSGGVTRLKVAISAMDSVYAALAEDSKMGLWQFSRVPGSTASYQELVPIGPIGEVINGTSRRNLLIQNTDRLQAKDNDGGLYDTALAAFRKLSSVYTPGRPNQVVLLTDGQDDNLSSISLDNLITKLRSEFDPEHPVHLITIAYGGQADAQALQRISAATDAKSYPARDENSISQVILDVLTTH
ncbi:MULTISPECIES: substrate-binding domain-containing protein [unclassified Frankia]|uniref:substrate-binding domain-containing protein n=2 Tax=Frankia TaxID=1854 RepID=UPI001EF6F4B3|nr:MULTISPECIES: substrate-binding domain-containing protein [unclassified Frankia]